jgi:hypothetical protein
MTTKLALQKILKGILHKDKNKHNHDMMGSIKPHEKNRQELREKHGLAAHTQKLKQIQLHGRNHHIPFNTNTEC